MCGTKIRRVDKRRKLEQPRIGAAGRESYLRGGGAMIDTICARMTTNAEQLIAKEELSKRLNLSAAGVMNLVHRRAIPFIRLGHRTIRFRWSEVETAIERYRQEIS